ncbi:sugar ABC transporter substrate-binding protein [Myxococcus sp. K15C18031901]|uniref:ABC transporter substrate-binding protein n=1 Tax=Myxococcus dinghuensis TaxID=2906761 RepID=UPI0020A6F6CA|nr:sugar ABC transporter substrate-binding protein [Myxococcus dinghuensis]MCP3097981.1 sugar ABC transporter substrate-binding protein [Myxococcus dinghuensis]
MDARIGRVALVALMLSGSACKRSEPSEGAKATEGGRHVIALLLPESKTARYESHDRPLFEGKVKALCPTCEVLYANADQDAARQQSQAEAALTNGAQVLVLDPVDSASASAIVARAKQSRIPVISYDRLVMNADVDYYISFDNEQVGQLQAQALVDKLMADGRKMGTLVAIHGSPTDNNARMFKAGAHPVLETSGYLLGAEYDTPDWSPDKAQQQMEQALTALGKKSLIGVYAANDGTAGGAIAAMKAAGISPLPPVTGQDAELAAIQRIVAGEQYMTVYKAIRPEAEAAAELAVTLARGQRPPPERLTGKVNNGRKDVASILLTPVAVTRDNVRDTVVADGFWKPEQICVGVYQQACATARLP